MSHTIQDLVEVTPSMLTPWQYMVMNAALHEAGFDQCTPEKVPDRVVSVCLKCMSTTCAPDARSRDMYSENYDFVCCGMTVVFHSVLFAMPMELISVMVNTTSLN